MIDLAAGHGGGLIEAEATPQGLADATAALAADPARFEQRRRAARLLAESAYSMDAVLPQWQQVWRVQSRTSGHMTPCPS